MAIGYNWAPGSFKDTAWVTGAWRAISTFAASLLTRTQIVKFISRIQGVK